MRRSFIDEVLAIDDISREDRMAVKEHWGDCAGLRVAYHKYMNMNSFRIVRPLLYSVIQNGQLVFQSINVTPADIEKIQLDKPFLALLDEDDYFAIYYVSYS